MRIVILLFQHFYVVVADNCECEVLPWNEWSVADATCGPAMVGRRRVCSTFDAWKLGLACIEADERQQEEYKPVELSACRKLSLNVKLIQVVFYRR